ncbi:hypothetical protein [Ectopseudomonas toyotomiensis]|nr:hypothetical protein [Pseudomonas toyotomiensis]MBG0843350.1 hypothetical protein [Pseudomonas toyotomiensis]
MTKAQERQAELDAQVEAFLAKGGEIKTYDNLCRPVELATASKEPEAAASTCAHGIRLPHECAQCEAEASESDIAKFMEETFPATDDSRTEVQLVQTERGEVRLAEIPVPASIAVSPDDVWKRLRNDIAATKRRLDRLGKKVTGQ